MYCPICKAEYRVGFEQCSDCLAKLASLDEATTAKVRLLWKGTTRSRFDEIVGDLRDAGIPHNARSSVSTERPRSFWDYVPIIRSYMQMYEQMTWQILVLESDFPRAQMIAENRS